MSRKQDYKVIKKEDINNHPGSSYYKKIIFNQDLVNVGAYPCICHDSSINDNIFSIKNELNNKIRNNNMCKSNNKSNMKNKLGELSDYNQII